jgi:hypothetical protein
MIVSEVCFRGKPPSWSLTFGTLLPLLEHFWYTDPKASLNSCNIRRFQSDEIPTNCFLVSCSTSLGYLIVYERVIPLFRGSRVPDEGAICEWLSSS